jgi:hypothetical protein
VTVYYALWIHNTKAGNITFAKPPKRRKIQDNEMWRPFFLWGKVDKETLNFSLWYSHTSNKEQARCIDLRHIGHNNHWFLVYSAELSDEETDDSFLANLKQNGMSNSVYHFIKDFFHQHVHHDACEDALLNCMTSNNPLSLDTVDGKNNISNYYIDLYDKKIGNFFKDVQDDYALAKRLVNNISSVAKGISLFADIIRRGRILTGEYEYCEFLMQHYTTGRAQKNKHIRDTMRDIEHELENISFDYQLCINAYSIKLGLYGVLFGVVGIFVSIGGMIHSYCSSQDVVPFVQHVDSVVIKQNENTIQIEKGLKKLDTNQQKLQTQNDTIQSAIQRIDKRFQKQQSSKTSK